MPFVIFCSALYQIVLNLVKRFGVLVWKLSHSLHKSPVGFFLRKVNCCLIWTDSIIYWTVTQCGASRFSVLPGSVLCCHINNLLLHSPKKKKEYGWFIFFFNQLAEVQQMEHYRHIGVSLISAELRKVPRLSKTGGAGRNNTTRGNIFIGKKIDMYTRRL